MPSTVEKALDGHDYASATSSNMKMETNTSIPGNKRSRQTPTKIPAPTRRRKQDDESLPSDIALGEDVSNATIFDAVKSLMSMVESFNSRLNENTLAIANLAKSLDFSSKEIKDCKDKMKILETQMSAVTAENKELKEQVLESERYKRRWNLRIHGLKENEGENTRERIIKILSKIAPQWTAKMEDVVDSAHRLGRKIDGKTRQIIVQFTMRIQRDAIWRASKNHAACEEYGVRFTEDLTKADKEARDAVWPKIKRARALGQTAFYRGATGYINNRPIPVP